MGSHVVVIGHAGIGSIFEGLKSKKDVIICDDIHELKKLDLTTANLEMLKNIGYPVEEFEKALTKKLDFDKSLEELQKVIRISEEELIEVAKEFERQAFELGVFSQEAINALQLVNAAHSTTDAHLIEKKLTEANKMFLDDEYRGLKHRFNYKDLCPNKNVKGKSQWKKPVKIKCRNRLK